MLVDVYRGVFYSQIPPPNRRPLGAHPFIAFPIRIGSNYGMSVAVTNGIRVEVESFYISERSDPDRDFWFFAYQVQIANEGPAPVRLVARHWVITDGNGGVKEVKGEGVVGSQPLLMPGESFAYQSACPLSTSVGSMHGSYQILGENGESFDATIAPFTLATPFSLN